MIGLLVAGDLDWFEGLDYLDLVRVRELDRQYDLVEVLGGGRRRRRD